MQALKLLKAITIVSSPYPNKLQRYSLGSGMDAGETKHCSKCDRPDSADNLVGCDTCEAWVHFGCANVTDSIADANRSWKCDKCLVREDDSVSQSRMSLGHSASSKHSSRASLVLRMMEEQKASRLRQIAEEELAQAVARKKRAAEEEQFIKQKYALLLGEVDELEDGQPEVKTEQSSEP
nr:uncharacterized protein LOC109419639 [Aedes albopictus]